LVSPSTQLRRNMANRQIAGVASGLSDFFGIDTTLVRVLFLLSLFFTGGAGPLIYLLCWLVVPKGPTPYGQPPRIAKRSLIWVIAVAALIVGIIIAINDHTTLFVAVVVLLCALLVWRKVRGRGSWKTRKEFEKARLAWQRRLDEQARQAAPTTYLGNDPFQIGSFYSPPPSPLDLDAPPGPLNLDAPPSPYDPFDPNSGLRNP